MFDVLEHLDDPMRILKMCNDKLKKNGVLILTTMDMDCLTAKILGKHYPQIMLMHKFYFTNNSLTRIISFFKLFKMRIFVEFYCIIRGLYKNKWIVV